MNARVANEKIGRRDLLRLLAIGTAAATTSAWRSTAEPEPATATPRARYQADSSEVQTFYRVNRYPGR
jgi:hypothetical protein